MRRVLSELNFVFITIESRSKNRMVSSVIGDDVQSFSWQLLWADDDSVLGATIEKNLQNFSLVLFLRQG